MSEYKPVFDGIRREIQDYSAEDVSDYLAEAEAVIASLQQQLEDKWTLVSEGLPKCSKKPGSFGVQVLVDPPFRDDGYSDMPLAYYGCRQTDKPNFYIYGRVFYPDRWRYLPPPPSGKNTEGEA